MPPIEWIPLIWLGISVLLLSLLLAQPSFDWLMFGALGALIVAIVSTILPSSLWLKILIFSAITLTGTIWLRRVTMFRHPSQTILNQRENVAEVLTEITPVSEGRVRWHGQCWAAISLDLKGSVKEGDQVIVIGREGSLLQILPMPDRSSG